MSFVYSGVIREISSVSFRFFEFPNFDEQQTSRCKWRTFEIKIRKHFDTKNVSSNVLCPIADRRHLIEYAEAFEIRIFGIIKHVSFRILLSFKWKTRVGDRKIYNE